MFFLVVATRETGEEGEGGTVTGGGGAGVEMVGSRISILKDPKVPKLVYRPLVQEDSLIVQTKMEDLDRY